jgi:hypothetical protein
VDNATTDGSPPHNVTEQHGAVTWCSMVLKCTALYCIVLYCIVLYCIVLYCIVLYCIVLYCIVLYCIVLYSLEVHLQSASDDAGQVAFHQAQPFVNTIMHTMPFKSPLT